MSGPLAIEPPWDQRLGSLIARRLASTGLHPNAVTTASLLAGLAAGGLFGLGGAWADWGAVAFAVAFFIDHIDGELARLTDKSSTLGHYYDFVVGGIILAALFIGMGVGLAGGALGDWSIVLGVVAGLTVAVIFSVRLDLQLDAGKEATQQPNFLGFEIEDVMYLVVPIAWAGGLLPFLTLAGFGAPFFLLWQYLASRRIRARGPAS